MQLAKQTVLRILLYYLLHKAAPLSVFCQFSSQYKLTAAPTIKMKWSQ